MTKTIQIRFLALLAAVACFSCLTQSAAACDRTRVLNQMKAIQQKTGVKAIQVPAQPKTNAPAPPQNGRAGIVGMWQVTATYQDQVVDVFFDTWHTDGNELFIDATNPIEDNVCQGIWTAVSSNTYKLKHESWYFDETGTLQGWAIFRGQMQLGADGNSYTGTENIYIYDTNGNLIAEFDDNVLTATRISVDF
jgi:hypothetical protein